MTSNDIFWKSFYDNKAVYLNDPSPFAKYIYDTYIKINDNVVYKIGDLGCGNCRDSNFFTDIGHKVFAIDKNGINTKENSKCQLICDDVEEILTKFKLQNLLDIIYMRWFLHAMPYDKAESIFNSSIHNLKLNGLICIEVRSINDVELINTSVYDETDRSYTTTHKRWLYNKEIIYNLANKNNLEILEYNEGYFSVDTNSETHNPLLIRFIARKKDSPNYTLSTNYHLYKDIIPTMYNWSFVSYTHMNIFNKILEENNIKYTAVAGTVLGLNRHGGIIPWDNDIDIGFIKEEWDKLFNIKDKLELSGYKYKFEANNHCHFGSVDCFLLIEEGDYYKGSSGTFCHKEEYETVCKQVFGYTYIYAPICSIKSLTHRYGANYFIEGDVNDNYHYKNNKIPRFILTPNDYQFQVKKEMKGIYKLLRELYNFNSDDKSSSCHILGNKV